MNRFRQFLESILYAGLKPGQKPSEMGGMRFLGPLRGPVERFLHPGAAPNDPLYLSNRTLWQRFRVAFLIGIPCLVLLFGLGLVFSGAFRAKESAFPAEMQPSQVAAKMLPNLDKDMALPSTHQLEVQDVHVEHHGAIQLVGKVRNGTDRLIPYAELIFDLTNGNGSRLGAVSTHVENIGPGQVVAFQFPLNQPSAAIALVREIRTR